MMQVGVLVVSLSLPVSAAASFTASEMTRIASAENILFGETREHLSEESRLRAIETNLFGDFKKSKNRESRFNAIDKMIGNAKQSYLLPPIAPQLDTGSSYKQETAPNSLGYAEEPASSSLKTPEEKLLKEAMDKYSSGDTVAAKRLFIQVTSMNPRSEDAFFNLGVISESEGNHKEALRYYKRAYELNPHDSELRNTVATLSSKVNQDRQAEAREQAQALQAKQEKADLENMQKSVADASNDYKAGRYNDAARKLESVIAKKPNDPALHYALGQAHRANGNLQKAKYSFDRAVGLGGNSSDSQIYLKASRDVSAEMNKADAARAQEARRVAERATPAGQITPFEPTAANPNLGRNAIGNSGIARVFRGSKVKRALAGSAVGAATGALWSATTKRSSIKSGAIQGALMGGLLGFVSGR